ncbi:xanthine dehydrogenase family protein subunit M [Bacillus sp. FJAT-29814]|uniref:FAD binding domain-containing protein n=1 Tax=Bacillus sp. FJAT-29814 TaxID=1729688 RepID=UPI0008379A1A|nr:FAD binding domain-containing protein [Bacillus sp. FJAT-29814]
MLPFDFDYYLPKNLQEAVELYRDLRQSGRQPMYISGATELITLGRIDLVFTDAVIDIKNIPECREMGLDGDYLVLGSALTLTAIEEANLFPLLTKTSSEIADHTARGKITLGGNICGQIFYREAVLPFLLADSQAVIIGPDGVKVHYIDELFQNTLQLGNGEFLVQLATEKRFVDAPFISIKRRQQWETGYPLITVAALKISGEIRIAISGLCPFPFRSNQMEAAINRDDLSVVNRVSAALTVLPEPILNDIEGSADYRLFVLQNLLNDILAELDGINA